MYALVEKYPQYSLRRHALCVRHSQGAAGNGGLRPHQHLRRQRGILPRRHPEDHEGSSLENGRFLRYIDVERHQNVCVIGSYLAENAFRTDPLGQTISVGGVPYMVVGVLAESGDSTEGSVDDVIYIPYASPAAGGGYGDMYLMTSTGPGYGVCCQGASLKTGCSRPTSPRTTTWS